jgi:hypothetical protein
MSSSSQSSEPPGMLGVFRSDLHRSYVWFRRQYDGFIAWFFDITLQAGLRRKYFLIASGLILWTSLAVIDPEIRWDLIFSNPFAFILSVGKAYFSMRVLRHVIIVLVAYRLAFRHASLYLEDIFELNNIAVADRYISQAAFGRQYNLIVIRDGAVAPESVRSPVFRIGGPGIALLHMENAAVFEKVDGTPHILSSRDPDRLLQSFERLRQVIDLRDQVMDLNVTGRSRDGILVTARDVRLIFSVSRGRSRPKNRLDYSQPYEFDETAIQNLVFNNSEHWAKEVRELIRESFRRFISEHTLTEFLANVSPLEKMTAEVRRSQAAGMQPVPPPGVQPMEISMSPLLDVDSDFIPRDQLSNLFYDFTRSFAQDAEELGVELQWIGLGTWVTPSEIIPEQYLEAWHLSLENHVHGNPDTLKEIRRESRNQELLRMIREVPITSFGRLQAEGRPADDIILDLLLTYREKLRNAWEIYQNSDEIPPSDLDISLRHLTRLTARWVS